MNEVTTEQEENQERESLPDLRPSHGQTPATALKNLSSKRIGEVEERGTEIRVWSMSNPEPSNSFHCSERVVHECI